jgi:hypothetical protein
VVASEATDSGLQFHPGRSAPFTIQEEASMVATGEYIRMTNYVDDIAATLRRIVVGTTAMTDEEKKRLAEYMRKVEPNYAVVLQQLEGAKG